MIQKLFPILKFTVFALYFSVLIYFICKDVKRYIDNEDSSSIAFRKFNAGPRDKYPVATFCLSGGTEGNLFIYNEKLYIFCSKCTLSSLSSTTRSINNACCIVEGLEREVLYAHHAKVIYARHECEICATFSGRCSIAAYLF